MFGFGIGAGLFSFLFMAVFALVIGAFVIMAVQGIRQWNRNNHSPRLTVPAGVVAKRADVTHHHSHSGGHPHHHTSTFYYVTFQVESGDRMELCVSGEEYGILVEGDFGALTFQGTRYLNFDRT